MPEESRRHEMADGCEFVFVCAFVFLGNNATKQEATPGTEGGTALTS